MIGAVSSVSWSSSPDGCSFSICIPKGRNNSRWSLFLRFLSQQMQSNYHTKGYQCIEYPFHSTRSEQQLPLLVRPSNFTAQAHRSNFPRPWSDPADSLRVVIQCRLPETSSDNDWAKAIICDCVESPSNLEATAKAIANACNFNSFHPLLSLEKVVPCSSATLSLNPSQCPQWVLSGWGTQPCS